MASWRDNEDDYNYTLRQVLKKIDNRSKSNFDSRDRHDKDIENNFDDESTFF